MIECCPEKFGERQADFVAGMIACLRIRFFGGLLSEGDPSDNEWVGKKFSPEFSRIGPLVFLFEG